jgi:arylsulfatase A-like enzyme
MFINYFQAHAPYLPPPPYHVIHKDPQYTVDQVIGVEQAKYKYLTGAAKWTEQNISALNSLYDGDITYLDVKLNEIFEWLRTNQVLDNTLLVITSDHGENIGEHNFKGHQFNVYDTLLHIPLIIRYPRLFSGGQRIKETVQTIDLFPSIMNIVGLELNNLSTKIQGASFLNGKNENHTLTLAEYFLPVNELKLLKTYYSDYDVSHLERRLATIRQDNYKYILGSDFKDELYDLRSDPDETNNLIHERPPGKATVLRKQLLSLSPMFGHPDEKALAGQSTQDLDPETRDKLKSLGYLQ